MFEAAAPRRPSEALLALLDTPFPDMTAAAYRWGRAPPAGRRTGPHARIPQPPARPLSPPCPARPVSPNPPSALSVPPLHLSPSLSCVAALSLRAWFAVELATCPELLARLTSAASEAGAGPALWRHTAAAALWATLRAAAGEAGGPGLLAGEEGCGAVLAAEALQEAVGAAVRAGPYGGGGGPGAALSAAELAARHETHHVATRGGA